MRKRKIKAALSVGVVLAGGVFVYGWWRLMRTPPAIVPNSQSFASIPGNASPGPGYSMAPALSDVDVVKNGTISEYKNTTVSRAFEKTFQDPEWKSVVNQFGQKVVTFRGTVRYAVLKEAGFYIGTWNGVLQGIEAENQISQHRHRCFVEAGQTETSASDDAVIAPCMGKAYQGMVIPVCFEFTLSPDRKSVEMTSPDSVFQKFDPDHRLRRYRDATLAFVYQ